MRKKSVLYKNPVIRKDNKKMAPCGNRSMKYCYDNRYVDSRCEGCQYIVVKGRRTKVFKKDGVSYAVCTHCGRTLPITEFYYCRKRLEDKYGVVRYYNTIIYKCRECYCKLNRISRQKRKDSNQNKNDKI